MSDLRKNGLPTTPKYLFRRAWLPYITATPPAYYDEAVKAMRAMGGGELPPLRPLVRGTHGVTTSRLPRPKEAVLWPEDGPTLPWSPTLLRAFFNSGDVSGSNLKYDSGATL